MVNQLQNTSPRSRSILLALFLILLIFVAYARIFAAGFIWDDDSYVTQNPTLQDLGGLRDIWFRIGAVPQYYPLVHTTFWLEHHLWGLNPLAYHFTNVLLHAIGVILFWRVLMRVHIPGAWLAAAIFAVHPVQVESVAWITERKNVLSAVFYFAAALSYLRFVELRDSGVSFGRSWYRYCGALVLFVGALFSKTVTGSLPAALLLVRWWKQGRLKWRDLMPLLPFFAISVAFAQLTAWLEKYHVGAGGPEWSISFLERSLIAGRAVWFYVGKLIWPVRLTFIYPRWDISTGQLWQWLFPTAAVGVLVIFWLARRRLGKAPLVAALFFAGTLGPALGFVNVYPFRYSFVADHFQYLPSIGLIALFAASATTLSHKLALEKESVALAVVLLLLLAMLTWRQTATYRDLETLWRDTIAKNPSCWLAHLNLGVVLKEKGQTDAAKWEYDEALRLNPGYPEALDALGVWDIEHGRTEDGIKKFQAALRTYPNYAYASFNLGNAFLAKGQLSDAIASYENALRFYPGYADAHGNLAVALSRVERLDDAIPHYVRALQLKPSAGAHNNFGVVLTRQARFDEAVMQFEEALRLDPDYVQARLNLARALIALGRKADAVANLNRAARSDPTNTEVQQLLRELTQ